MRKVLFGVVMCLAILALATPGHSLLTIGEDMDGNSWGQAF